MSQSLTPCQRDLVDNVGFLHLLDLKCNTLPKGVILWLVKHFNVRTRTFNLPNGFCFTISPSFIHEVLHIPLGGKTIPSQCDESFINLIARETGCADRFPTINELMLLITESLDGDRFLRIFMLFTLSCFLCPTSYDHASPEYYSAISKSDEISSYNWCGAVLDKIVLSIYKFQQARNTCGTTALGGCVLVLAVCICVPFPFISFSLSFLMYFHFMSILLLYLSFYHFFCFCS